jgi:hypothetical protein
MAIIPTSEPLRICFCADVIKRILAESRPRTALQQSVQKDKDCRPLGCGAVKVLSEPMFWWNVSPPSPVQEECASDHLRQQMASGLIVSALKMEATRSYETSVRLEK